MLLIQYLPYSRTINPIAGFLFIISAFPSLYMDNNVLSLIILILDIWTLLYYSILNMSFINDFYISDILLDVITVFILSPSF